VTSPNFLPGRTAAASLLIVAALAGCGGRGGEDELMRRVAQADAAVARAEAAALRAEQAANRAASGSDEPEVVVEADEPVGQGTEPEPMIDPDE
jgi:hypothetical protein